MSNHLEDHRARKLLRDLGVPVRTGRKRMVDRAREHLQMVLQVPMMRRRFPK